MVRAENLTKRIIKSITKNISIIKNKEFSNPVCGLKIYTCFCFVPNSDRTDEGVAVKMSTVEQFSPLPSAVNGLFQSVYM